MNGVLMVQSGRCLCRTLAILVSLAVSSVSQSGPPAPSGPATKAQASTPAGVAAQSDVSASEAIIIERSIAKVSFEADGTGVRETTVAMRVQSQAGVQQLAVLTFAYTSDNQTVELDYVRVRKADGTVVLTPEYNIQDMPAEVSRSAPMYSDVHEKHVTVKALAVGDVLEYVVRYRTYKPLVPGQFWFEYSFTKSYIVKDEELEISVPRDRYLKITHPDYPPHVDESGTRKTYSWKTSNLSVKDREESQKLRDLPKPSVQLTTFRDWGEVGSWYEQLQLPQLVVTPQIQAKAAELTRGLTTDDDKIRAIYDYVSTRFHYVSLSFGIGRYQPHAAADVLENEYGDCKDKHTLLASLLKAAGFDAWPALMNATRKIDPDIPSPGQFNHVITVVPRGVSIVWLDTTPEVAPFGLILVNLRDRYALVIPTDKAASLEKAGSLMMTPSQPPFPALQAFHVEGALSTDGTLTARVQQTTRGDTEVIFRAAYRATSNAQWKDLVQRVSYASGFSGDVSNVNVSAPDDTKAPFQVSYDYTKKSFGDWDNHRIVAPLPWFGLESSSMDEKKPAEPVLLGALGSVVLTSKTTLPSGYAPKYSDRLDLAEDFADYHATYSIENGVLTANRTLIIKKSEVPLSSWEAYKKFRKALADERDRYIDLAGGKTEYPAGEGPAKAAGVASSTILTSGEPTGGSKPSMEFIMAEASRRSPEAARLFQEGAQAGQRNDLTQAEELFRKTIALDPKFPNAHGALAFVLMQRRDLEGTLSELRLEIEYNPELPTAYPILVSVLDNTNHHAEAMEVSRKWFNSDPGNLDAAMFLSKQLSDSNQSTEAVAVLESAIKLHPDSPTLQYVLGDLYLKNKKTEEGAALLRKAVAANSDTNLLNNVAYAFADAKLELEFARECGEKALAQVQSSSMAATDDSAGLSSTRQLDAVWDTLGWVYFRLGDDHKALSYVRAAWLLGQQAVYGDHLGQIYEKMDRKPEALHAYKLALAAIGGTSPHLRERYEKLSGAKASDADVPRLRRSPNGAYELSPGEELSKMRTVKLNSSSKVSGNAVFIIVFSPTKPNDVRFVSGDEALKPMFGPLGGANYKVEFPDLGPFQIFRRAMVVCGSLSGCDAVLLLPADVQ
jgi:tetratricopeptide (TPR) repeat protein/transglutaminase-like putative cysteine protease